MKDLWILLALLVGPLLARPAPVAVDSFAAMVSSNVITSVEVMGFIQPDAEQARRNFQGRELGEHLQKLYNEGLEKLIERQLILEQFRSRGGALPDRSVDDKINDIIRSRFKGDYAAFQKALFAGRQTLEDFRRDVKEGLIVQWMRREEVLDHIRVPLGEVIQVYQSRREQFTIAEQVSLQVIQLTAPGDPSALGEHRRRASSLAARLREGGMLFSDAARSFSTGFNAEEGGPMGWKNTADIRAEILGAVKDFAPGQVSDPVSVGDDLLIVKLLGRRPAGLRPLVEAAPEIEEEIFARLAEEAHREWIRRLRARFPVTVF